MGKKGKKNICQRIAQVRLEQDGPRGKSRFAKKLGISPSTYDCYESSRVPSAELLVKIAEIAQVDLRWLLTGQAGDEGGNSVAPQHPAVKRAAKMLDQYPDVAKPLGAFLDILAGTLAFPAKDITADSGVSAQGIGVDTDGVSIKVAPQPPVLPCHTSSEINEDSGSEQPALTDPRAGWIPILGRSAAGVPQFWNPSDDTTGLTTLTQLIEKHLTANPEQMDIRNGEVISDFQLNPHTPGEAVQIISLRTPDESGVSEFIAAPRIKSAYKDAFAVRIDGDSMVPEIQHGDLLILSPSVPAVPYKPTVAQLCNSIGVTCKLYQPGGIAGVVNLIPINEQYPSTTVSLDDIQWALCVLGKIRPRG